MDLTSILEKYDVAGVYASSFFDAFQPVSSAAGSTVFHEGDTSDAFYFISSGRALVTKGTANGEQQPLAVMEEGDFFGEVGLLDALPRTATVKALVDLATFRLKAEDFRSLIEQNDTFAELLKKIARRRLLRQSSLFRNLPDEGFQAIQDSFEEIDYPAKASIFHEGETPDSLSVIVQGRVTISTQTRQGREMPLASLGPGDMFGEMGLLEDLPRSADATTEGATRLLSMSADKFKELAKHDAVFSFALLTMMSKRVRRMSKNLSKARDAGSFKGITIIAREDRCLSCRACEIACSVAKSESRDLYGALDEEPRPVRRIHVRHKDGESGPAVRPEHCRQCWQAPCITSCRLKAIRRDSGTGTVVIDSERCVGCGKCLKACPYRVISVVRTDGKKRMALKCTFCAEHEGGPACVRACPTNALVIGLSARSGEEV